MVFRFRAAAALDVRRKQEETARIASAKAESAWAAARASVTAAEDAILEDRQQAIDLQRNGTEVFRVQWHEAWAQQLRRDAVTRQKEADERAAESAAAQKLTQEAMRRRRVLERLRDRALRKHRRHADAQHVKEMNELATLRFVAQISEGDSHGH